MLFFILFILILVINQSLPYENLSNQLYRTKHITYCELFKINDGTIKSSCDLEFFNFTLYAHFRQKRGVKYRSLTELTETLSSHASCEIKYMKYNFWSEKLEYLETSEDLIWYEGKKLSNKQRPEIILLNEQQQKSAQTLIFKCKLPEYSDTYLSMKDSESIQLKRVSVSGFHIRLNFLPLDDILINISKINNNNNKNSATTPPPRNAWLLNLKKKAEINKHIIFYDRKCRLCFNNIRNTTINNRSGYLEPNNAHSIKCLIKVKKKSKIFSNFYEN
jgi:hypothetical protein